MNNMKACLAAEWAVGLGRVGGQQERGEITLRVCAAHYLDAVLINSGALCNLIDNQTWNSLKQKHMKCGSQESDWELFAYPLIHITLERPSLVFILIQSNLCFMSGLFLGGSSTYSSHITNTG